MPVTVRIGTVAFGVSGLLLLGLGFRSVLGNAGNTTLGAFAGVLGIAELVVVGRLVERRQAARLLAMGMSSVQALGAVIALAQRELGALALVVLAACVVLPLSNATAERFFSTPPP